MNKKNVYGGILIAIIIATVSFLISLKEPNTIVGSQGLQGPQGEQGPQGPQGPAGKDGRDGKDGKNGSTFGAVSGSDFYNLITANAGVQYSNTTATSSTGAGTLTANDVTNKTTILSTNAGVLTLTLPASTTLTSFIPRAGDRTSVVIVNQGTALLTLAGGTGTLLQTASSTKTVNIGGSATLNFVRKANSDIVVHMSPAI